MMEVDEEGDTVVVVAVATRGTQVCEACVGATRSAACSCGRDDGGITDPLAWSLVMRNAAGDLVGFAARVTEETAMLAAKGVANVSLNTTIGGVVGGVSGAVSGAVTGLFWTALSAMRLGLSASVSLVSYLAQKGVQVVRGPNGSSVLRIPGETPEAPVSEVQLLHLNADEYHRRRRQYQADRTGDRDAEGEGEGEGEATLGAVPGSAAARRATTEGAHTSASSGVSSSGRPCEAGTAGGVSRVMSGTSMRSVGCQTEMLAWKPKADNPQSFVNFLHVPTAKVRMGDMQPLSDRTRVSQQAAKGEGAERGVPGMTAVTEEGAVEAGEAAKGSTSLQQRQHTQPQHQTQSLGMHVAASPQGGRMPLSLPPQPRARQRHPYYSQQQPQQPRWAEASVPVARDGRAQPETTTTMTTPSVGVASAPPLPHDDRGGGGGGLEGEAGCDVEVSPGGTRRQRKRWVIPNTAPDIKPTAPAMGE